MDGWMVVNVEDQGVVPVYAMMTGGVEVQLRIFLTCVLDGGEWSTLHPGKEPR